jgi:hypothetical protein
MTGFRPEFEQHISSLRVEDVTTVTSNGRQKLPNGPHWVSNPDLLYNEVTKKFLSFELTGSAHV